MVFSDVSIYIADSFIIILVIIGCCYKPKNYSNCKFEKNDNYLDYKVWKKYDVLLSKL